MKAIIEIDFDIDGVCPNNDSLEAAVFGMITDASYILSESIDGTAEWGIDINGAEIKKIEGEKHK